MKLQRISSTQLRTYDEDCARRWWYGRHDPIVQSEPMAIGTVLHARAEFWIANKGRWPTIEEVREMDGNYEPPSAALDAYPDSWEKSDSMAQALEDNQEDIFPDGLDCLEVELDLEDFDLTLAGDVRAGGYIDVFDRERKIIYDFKTRGSLKYMPRTDADFRGNLQFSYYGAAAARALGWDEITVKHINLLRGGSKVVVAGTTMPGFYLDAVWELLDTDLVPKMKADADKEAGEVRRNPDGCWKYGSKCPFYGQCAKDGTVEKSFHAWAKNRGKR